MEEAGFGMGLLFGRFAVAGEVVVSGRARFPGLIALFGEVI